MTKNFVAILIAVIISLSMMISASAYTYQYIEDPAGNLTYDEIEELEAYAEKIESTYGICIMLGIARDTDGMSDSEYAQKIYTDNTDNENGFILVHNDSESTYGVFTSGNAKEIFDEEAVNEMRDAYNSSNSYYGGISDYYKAAESLLASGETASDNAQAVTTDDDTSEEKDGVGLIWIPVSLGIGLLIGFLIINSIASKNKSVHMQKNATVYTRPGSMIITGSADNFLYSNVERREKPKQENKK